MMRRVVVTGLGAVTPLGVGVRRTWSRLIAGESGLRSVADREPRSQWRDLTSTVAGLVPVVDDADAQVGTANATGRWVPSDWLSDSEQRRMSTFTQYAVAAADMALEDAGWKDKRFGDPEMVGVCLGSGIGNLDEMYKTSLAFGKEVSASRPKFGTTKKPSTLGRKNLC
jgi:3-oxoacyl-[acyl-carrier-protein] synthase II